MPINCSREKAAVFLLGVHGALRRFDVTVHHSAQQVPGRDQRCLVGAALAPVPPGASSPTLWGGRARGLSGAAWDAVSLRAASLPPSLLCGSEAPVLTSAALPLPLPLPLPTRADYRLCWNTPEKRSGKAAAWPGAAAGSLSSSPRRGGGAQKKREIEAPIPPPNVPHSGNSHLHRVLFIFSERIFIWF